MTFTCKCGSTKHYAKHLCRKCYDRAKQKTERYKQYEREYRKDYRKKDNVKEYHKTYRNKLKFKEQHSNYEKDKRKCDISFRLKKVLRTRLGDALSGRNKSGSAVRDLGCSVDYFKQYLESRFDSNMTWDNYGTYWTIDHIIPLSAFNLECPLQLAVACNYTNLQPMEKIANIKKGGI